MAGVPFPHRIRGTAQARTVCRAATDAFLGGGQDFSCVVIRDLRPAQREYLTALHVISPELAALSDGEVIRSRDDAMSVMLLEEDHYRLQYLTGRLCAGGGIPGLPGNGAHARKTHRVCVRQKAWLPHRLPKQCRHPAFG